MNSLEIDSPVKMTLTPNGNKFSPVLHCHPQTQFPALSRIYILFVSPIAFVLLIGL